LLQTCKKPDEGVGGEKEKVNKLTRHTLIVALIILILTCSLGYVYSLYTTQKNMTASVVLHTESLKVYDADGVNEISAVDFGTVGLGEVGQVNLTVKNIGSITLDLAWSHVDLPTGVTLTARYSNGSGGMNPWNEGDYGIGMLEPQESRLVELSLSYGSSNEGEHGFSVVFDAREST
jgi:hypothetical protein